MRQKIGTSPEAQRSAAQRLAGGPVVALVAALPALWPLLRPGFFVSDDGLIHVYRIAALANAWRAGDLWPRLFPDFGFGYGQAVLNFYAPLSYVPGAALAWLGVSPAAAAQWTIALGFLLAALAMYGLGRALWGHGGGVLGAVAYTYFPYHLADAYQRGAIPEHLAFVWLPLLAWSAVSIFRLERRRWAILGGALAWAGLVYTHNLTALMLAPAWAWLALLMAAWTGNWRGIRDAGLAAGLALLLSAPLWLPFLAESQFVGIAQNLSDGYRNHLTQVGALIQQAVFYRYRAMPGGGAEHPLSWLTPAVLLLALIAWVIGRARRPFRDAPLLGFFVVLAMASIWLTIAPALGIWRAFEPVLGQLQYPWRFLALAALGVAGTAAALPALLGRGSPEGGVPSGGAHEGGHGGPPLPLAAGSGGAATARGGVGGRVVVALGVLLVLQPLLTVPAQPLVLSAADAWAPDRMWREDFENGQVGATWTGEFLPLTVREQRWAIGRPLEGALDGQAQATKPVARVTSVGYGRIGLAFDAGAPPVLRLHQFHLPNWRAWAGDSALVTKPSGELGLVTVDLPAGTREVAFQFGPTRAAMAAAVFGLLGAVGWAALALKSARRWRWSGPILVALALLLLANGLGLGKVTRVPTPSGAGVGDIAVLMGHEVTPARGDSGVDVTLYWLALRDVAKDFKVFVHLVGPDGAVVTQHDGDPVGGFTPTTRWRANEVVVDRHHLPLPTGTDPAGLSVKVGMYELVPGETPATRALAPDPATPDGRIDLGSISERG